jgi:glycogen debranching enzyme
MRSGFGLRTVSTEAALYNPMGYHVGSVWPHDTSIAAAGAAKAGRMSFAVMLFDDLFAAAQCFPDMRLPELFCGFDRREVACAAPYLSACAPQAWAAGAPFLMLEALLGIEVDALARRISFAQTALPTGVDLLKIRRLPMGGRSIDLNVRRSGVSSTLEVVSAPQDVSFSFRT